MTRGPTIYALSSGGLRSGVAVIRVSGAQARETAIALAGELPPPRKAALRSLIDPDQGDLMDRGLVLWFPGPDSFTGEDVVEFQVHGGRAVIAAVLGALGNISGLRPADPGEFARRAFEHGKFDLTAAEGLADLIEAETESQRRQALRQMDGALGNLYEGWRGRLVEALAHLEADLEFPDEELNPQERSKLHTKALAVAQQISQEIVLHLDDQHRGERLRAGAYVAILGEPNVGKSSLLNALARRDAAIVSDTAGTTRDVIEVQLDLAGYPVTLADTAGLRAAPKDKIEQEGMSRAAKSAASADLKLVLCDATTWPQLNKQTSVMVDDKTYLVVNKVDCVPGFKGQTTELPGAEKARGLWPISAVTGEGVTALLDAVGQGIEEILSPGVNPTLTRARHRQALEVCRDDLNRMAVGPSDHNLDPELAAEDLRLATRILGKITGKVDVEDILDVIFADFCIGK